MPGIIWRRSHSSVWSLDRVALKTETTQHSICSRPLHVAWLSLAARWPLHGDFGLWARVFWLTRRKLPHLSDLALGVTKGHFCCPDLIGGKLGPVSWWEDCHSYVMRWEILLRLSLENIVYIIFSPLNGNLCHLKIIPYRSHKLIAAY